MQVPVNTTANESCHAEEKLHYDLCNECYRRGDWKAAIQHYLEACECNSESPAREKLDMVYRILNFYNKDIYGQ
jgi:hypothetical protein